MVRTEDVVKNAGVEELTVQMLRGDEVVDAPTRIIVSSMTTIAPRGLNMRLVGIEVTECVRVTVR